MADITISSAQYANADNTTIKVTMSDGSILFVPDDPANRHRVELTASGVSITAYS